MRICGPLSVFLPVWVLGVPGLGQDSAASLNTWNSALARFREVGVAIEKDDLDGAKKLLERTTAEFRSPYREITLEARQELVELTRVGLDPFNGGGITIDDKEALGGYYYHANLGRICHRWYALHSAARLYWKAVEAHPDDHYGVGRELGKVLLQLRAEEAQLIRLLKMTKHKGPQEELAKGLESLRQHLKNKGDVGYALDNLGGDTLSSLENLERIEPLLTNDAQRLKAYKTRIDRLSRIKDIAGCDAWEDKLLEEFSDNLKACLAVYESRLARATSLDQFEQLLKQYRRHLEKLPDVERDNAVARVLFGRSMQARHTGNRQEALVWLKQITSEYPKTKLAAAAVFDTGVILQELQRFDEAIAAYETVFVGKLDDLAPGPHLMEAYANYRNRAANAIRICHEQQDRPVEALRWAILARDKYMYQSWCGTCAGSAESLAQAEVLRLTFAAKRTREALRLTEAAITDTEPMYMSGWDGSEWRPLFAKLVDHHQQEKDFDKLKERFQLAATRNKQAAVKELERSDNPSPYYRKLVDEYDGSTPGMRFATEYARMKRLLDEDDLSPLWQMLQTTDKGAMQVLSRDKQEHWKAYWAASQLSNDKAKSFLLGKLKATDPDRAWASVLLARIKHLPDATTVCEWLEELSKRHDHTWHDEQAWQAGRDYAYALLLNNPMSGQRILKHYAEGENRFLSSIADGVLGEWSEMID